MIVPSTPVKSTSGEGLYIKGFDGFNYGIDELNNISAIYGTGKGAIRARSLTAEDIEKIMGITEEKKKEISRYYGKEIIATSGTWIDGTKIDKNNPKKAIENYYWFDAKDEGMITKENQKLYDLIFIDDQDESVYILATKCMWTNDDFNFAYFDIGWNYFDEAYMVDNHNVSYDYAYRTKTSCYT